MCMRAYMHTIHAYIYVHTYMYMCTCVHQPVGRGRRIGCKTNKQLACVRGEIASDHILRFKAILNEVCVAQRLERHVVCLPSEQGPSV